MCKPFNPQLVIRVESKHRPKGRLAYAGKGVNGKHIDVESFAMLEGLIYPLENTYNQMSG